MKKSTVLLIIISVISLIDNIAKAQYQTFYHNGIIRNYIVHLPPMLPPNSPLVFLLHGYGGTPLDIINYSGMNDVADANQFAVCYPEGTEDDWNRHCWNLKYDFQIGMTADDVDFLDSLAFYLQTNYNLDPEKTFCSGHSNGGDMCYRIACQDAGNFKAVAAVSGCLMKWIHDSCANVNPIPVFEIHGTEDQTTLWNGDMFNLQGYGPYYSVPFTFDFWGSVNNWQNEIIDTLPDLDPTDGSIVISYKKIDGINGNQVWLYKELRGGHGWPGSGGPGTNMDINTSSEIWSFFQTYNIVTSQKELDRYIQEEVITSPNPSKESVKITLWTFVKPLPFEVFDLYGKSLMKGELNSRETVIDISHLAKGIYLLKVSENYSKTIKMIKG